MKKKVLLAALILMTATGCGKVPVLKNGEEAVVSFEKESLNISVDELYNAMKDRYALNILIDLIDTNILLDKYPEDAEDAEEYVTEEIDKVNKTLLMKMEIMMKVL